ncbi:hypothetical protein HYC85_026096 [Camellia sinensis]|uniref:Uncharacterized protein n=1 Tax=Camellia sinensis TaxID=4442 RepID=A0A7J7G372_CAMSI|nr:hypothetical protein HYC85_026096 [Camellia sinensis]
MKGFVISSIPSVGDTSITAVPLHTCNRTNNKYLTKNSSKYYNFSSHLLG